MLRPLSRIIGAHAEKRLFSCQTKAVKESAVDPSQIASLEYEQCIVVDNDDKMIGSASKRACHRIGADGKIPLHRAFSVFLFNNKGEMLLQRRASKKVTFPNCLTNACCSHPLFLENHREEEVVEAAQRRLHFELGIPLKQMRSNMFTYMTRIHYFDAGDGTWGEHEIDYILMLRDNFTLDPNPDEVSEVRFIPRDNFNRTITSMGGPITPWFDLVRHHRLKEWWDNLSNLDKFIDHQTIHKFPTN